MSRITSNETQPMSLKDGALEISAKLALKDNDANTRPACSVAQASVNGQRTIVPELPISTGVQSLSSPHHDPAAMEDGGDDIQRDRDGDIEMDTVENQIDGLAEKIIQEDEGRRAQELVST